VKPKFWLWPNLLSLDAPFVAVLWQVLFLRCLGAPVEWAPAVLLFFTVWLIYAADRLLDARRGRSGLARHEFYRRHFVAMAAVCGLVLAALVGLVISGAADPLLTRGFGVLAAVLLYLACVHGRAANRIGLKEASVAVLFALGTSLPAWNSIRSASDVATVVLFSALCWLNCIAIEQWETGPRHWPVSLLALVIGSAGLVMLHHDRPILSGAIGASLFAIVLLDSMRARFSRDALRVLADAALLTPLLFLPIVR
jgi:hypothetical protein